MITIERVYPKVREIIADVLVIDEDDVSLNSRLISDLGAESIDFLDLVFQLEKNARGDLSEHEFEKGGVLTDNGLAALKNYLSEVPEEQFKTNMKVNEIPLLFTVETFCKLIIAAKQAQAIQGQPA